MNDGHWVRWHDAYRDPGSNLSLRLGVVTARLREVLDRMPTGPITVVSMCAGEGRDVIGAMSGHVRCGDVAALLVENDPYLVANAQTAIAEGGLSNIRILLADAGNTNAYEEVSPIDVLLVCGVFGNIVANDIRNTIRSLPSLLNPGGVVMWTRHRAEPDATPQIRQWFEEAGFEELSFDTHETASFGVGVHCLRAEPTKYETNRQLFRFAEEVIDKIS